MAKYWKTLGLKRAPATLKLLEMAYNTRLEAFIEADDTESIKKLHEAYKAGKKDLNKILKSKTASPKAPHRKPAPTKRKNTIKSEKRKDEPDDGLSLDDFMTATPPPAPKPEVISDYKTDETSSGFDELAEQLKVKNEDIIRKEKNKRDSRQKKTNKQGKGFIRHVLSGLVDFYKRYFTFSGRTSRGDFWGAMAFIGGVFAIFTILVTPEAVEHANSRGSLNTVSKTASYFSIFVFLNIIPMLAITLRRLHDIGKGGGWMCILIICMFIPVFNVGACLLWLIFTLRKGDKNANQYGPSPVVRE